MPRSGGIYQLPSGNPIEAGSVANSTSMNATLDDLGDEITNSIPRDGTAAATGNLPMGSFKHTNVANAAARNQYAAAGQVQDGAFHLCTNVAGTANAITADLTPNIAAYANGMHVVLTPGADNTNTVTLALNGLTAKPVLNLRGEALVAGDFQEDLPVLLYYSGNTFYYVSGGGGGESGAEVAALVASVVDSAGYAYFPGFDAGSIAYHGPAGTLAFTGQFILSTELPNPSGIPCPALMIGGAEQARSCITTDEQIPGMKGIDLIIAAGNASTADGNAESGGDLLLFAGAGWAAIGGTARLQGGTSVGTNAGGHAILKGGDCTPGSGPRGDAFVQGGESGAHGGNVHLIMTQGSGDDGEIRFRANSDILWTIQSTGAVFFKDHGAGLLGQPLVSGGDADCPRYLETGFTGTVTLAKLTGGGSNGSLTVESGLITGYSDPT